MNLSPSPNRAAPVPLPTVCDCWAIIPRFSLGPYLVGVGIVLTATLVAAFLPSLRATKIDPSAALRVD